MCIIACKPVGLQMPTDEIITNMWNANSDGAGIMYNHNGQVHIEKGFMKLPDFFAALDRIRKNVDLTTCGVVMHFRITTHGGTKPENTHPFPISSNVSMLKKLQLHTDVGVAHNGIIHITTRSKDISDTMEYVASQLAPLKAALPRFWENKDAMLLVKNAIQSKMAFLDGTGTIRTIGDFVESDGILYSNRTYEDYWKTSRFTGYWGWDWDGKANKWARDTYVPKHTTSLVEDDDDDTFPFDGDRDLIEPHYLMPIMDVDGSFYTELDGTMAEDYDYVVFIDYKGRIWSVDWDTGVAYRDDTITGVYGPDGMRLAYDYHLAELIDCYDFDDGILYLPDSGKKGGKK